MTQEEAYRIWSERLAANTDKQGSAYLRCGDEFCPLGVLCELLRDELDLDIRRSHYTGFSYNGSISALPEKVKKFMDMGDDEQAAMILANDTDKTPFSKIAKHVKTKATLRAFTAKRLNEVVKS